MQQTYNVNDLIISADIITDFLSIKNGMVQVSHLVHTFRPISYCFNALIISADTILVFLFKQPEARLLPGP